MSDMFLWRNMLLLHVAHAVILWIILYHEKLTRFVREVTEENMDM